MSFWAKIALFVPWEMLGERLVAVALGMIAAFSLGKIFVRSYVAFLASVGWTVVAIWGIDIGWTAVGETSLSIPAWYIRIGLGFGSILRLWTWWRSGHGEIGLESARLHQWAGMGMLFVLITGPMGCLSRELGDRLAGVLGMCCVFFLSCMFGFIVAAFLDDGQFRPVRIAIVLSVFLLCGVTLFVVGKVSDLLVSDWLIDAVVLGLGFGMVYRWITLQRTTGGQNRRI